MKQLKPGPDHPITIEPLGRPVSVTIAGTTVAATERALLLREAAYPPVIYIPREDTNMDLLERTAHSSHCPYKGEASYYSVPKGGERSNNAVWTYETPYEAVAAIRGHLAFYPDRIDSIQ